MPQRQDSPIVHLLNSLPALLPSWKDCLDGIEQGILVGVTVIWSTTTTGASLPVGFVIGFGVGRKGTPLSLALTLFGLTRGLGANVLLFRTGAVVVLGPVPVMSKGGVLMLIV
jgi:hypothetical protein